jgi:hypothetical protein
MNGHFDWHAVYTNDGFRRILIGDKFGRIYLVNLGRFFGLGNCVHIFCCHSSACPHLPHIADGSEWIPLGLNGTIGIFAFLS